MVPQCPSGEDEEGCHIPDSARLMMSLFITSITVVLITITLDYHLGRHFMQRTNIRFSQLQPKTS